MSRATPRFRRPNPPMPALTQNMFQVNVLLSVQGQTAINTFYYGDGQAVGVGVNPTGLAIAMLALLPLYQPIMGTDCTVVGVTVRCLNNPSAISVTRLLPTPLPGTVASTSLGTMYAATILRQTVVRGQAGRGRVTSPGVPFTFANVPATTLMPAAGTAYVNWCNLFLMTSVMSGGVTYVPYLYSRGLRTQTPKVPGAAPLLSFLVKALIGTVRRRKIGRGK